MLDKRTMWALSWISYYIALGYKLFEQFELMSLSSYKAWPDFGPSGSTNYCQIVPCIVNCKKKLEAFDWLDLNHCNGSRKISLGAKSNSPIRIQHLANHVTDETDWCIGNINLLEFGIDQSTWISRNLLYRFYHKQK